MAIKLKDIQWGYGGGANPLYDVVEFAVKPVKQLALILEEEVERSRIHDLHDLNDREKTERLVFAAHEIVNKVEELQEILERLDDEAIKERKAKSSKKPMSDETEPAVLETKAKPVTVEKMLEEG